MKIYFAHGMESGPRGSKILRMEALAQARGLRTESLDYTDLRYDAPARVERLITRLSDEPGPFLLAGSSMGAYVSAVAAQTHTPAGLFLLAPAIFLPGYEEHPFTTHVPTTIVHGWRDEIIPLENVIQFGQLQRANLHLLDGDHRLLEVLDQVATLFDMFLEETLRRLADPA